ncbi:hypothetical protein [Phaffia rhodozyma]|uniref:Uncharacterized protein n=1 Tax=Phaffia rhodozyma TaxID=264483 RepID=A0A0F7SX63_PHARH|nr:hypothetical protein [Phaffia rhodozyma]
MIKRTFISTISVRSRVQLKTYNHFQVRTKSTTDALAGTAQGVSDTAANISAKAGDTLFGALDGSQKVKDSLQKEETGEKDNAASTAADLTAEAAERAKEKTQEVQYKK